MEARMCKTTALAFASLLLAACGESRTAEPEPRAVAAEPAQIVGDEPAAGALSAPAARDVAAPAARDEAAPAAVGSASEGAARDEVADVIIIVPLGGTKESIAFPHKMHADPALNPVVGGKCVTCHHEAKAGQAEQRCTTARCHDDGSADVPRAKDSFHELCRDGCHKETRAVQPENEKLQKLKVCKGCHSVQPG
jgi:cytochrome c peroxidase